MTTIAIRLLVTAAIFLATISTCWAEEAASSSHEHAILEAVRRGDWRDSIVAAAEYEQHLLSRYPAPTFEMDLFRSQADSLSFHSTFIGWKRVAAEELDLPQWLAMTGFNVPLVLRDDSDENRFLLLTMDVGRLEQGLGLTASGEELSERELELGATLLAGNFGEVERQEFKQAGSHQILLARIATPMNGPPVLFAALSQSRKLYAFVVVSSPSKRAENEISLFKLMQTADFKHQPPDQARIAEIRRGAAGDADPGAILRAVRRLADIGEYSTAAEDLRRLRNLLASRLPPASIEGNTARFAAYDVALTNPDPKKWNLEIQKADDGGTVLVLEDRWSVKQEGLAVVVLDIILVFGPQATKALASEDLSKELLTSGGRGSALAIGEIEEESFATLKGRLAYVATVVTKMPGTKAKVIWILRPGSMVGVVMMLDSTQFTKRGEEYEAILEGKWFEIGSS